MKEAIIKAGVIGVGHLGRHHARIYEQLPHVKLIGVADINEKNLKAVTDQFGCPGYQDFRELIDQIDLVSVAVPTTVHYEVAAEFLKKGKHTLVEKPITATVEQGQRLIALARDSKAVLMVGQSERFNPAVFAALNYVKAPRFIEVHRLGSFSTRATDVDVVLDLMIHDIDLILNWVKSDIKEIKASGVPVLTKRIDIANARIEFVNHCIANVTASRVSMKSQRKIRVFQQDSYLSIDCLNQEISCFKRKQGDIPIHDPMSAIEPVSFNINKVEPLKAEIQSFIEAVRTLQEAPVTGEAGLMALSVCEKIADQIRDSIHT